jgi:hypothetical protein
LKSIDEIMRAVSGSNNALEVLKAVPVTPDYSKLSESLGRTSNPARWTYERLGEYIKDFESELDEEHEIGVRLVSFGQTISFHVQNIGYYGPDIITFYGTNENGEKLQLIQNLSQLSFLLIAVKKLQDKPKRIGFIWDDEKKDKEDKDE